MTEHKNDWCELPELYVLDALSIEEREQFENHLKECAECVESVRVLRGVAGLLPLASKPVEPPAGMKRRVLAHVLQADASRASEAPGEGAEAGGQVRADAAATTRADAQAPTQEDGQASATASSDAPSAEQGGARAAEQPAFAPRTQAGRASRGWRYATLALAAVLVALLAYTGQLRRDVDRLKGQVALGTQPVQGAQVNKAVALNPAAQDIVAKGLATIVIDKAGTHLVVQAEKLPELKGTQAYQVWLLKGDTPYNAGTFLARDGNGALYYTIDQKDYDTVAITLEPDALGDKPRGKIVLAAPIQKG